MLFVFNFVVTNTTVVLLIFNLLMKPLYKSLLYHYNFSILSIVFLIFFNSNLQAQTEITTAKQYLKENTSKLKLVDSDLSDMTVSSAYLSPTTGWYHVYFNQNYQSIEVYNSMINMVLQKNQVEHTVSNFVQNIASKINKTNIKNISLSPLQAFQKATAHLKLTASNVSKIKEIVVTKLQNGAIKKATFLDTNLSNENIEVTLFWLPVEVQVGEKMLSNVNLSWNIKLLTKDKQNSWSIHVDALSGEILRQEDEVIHCNFGTLDHLKNAHICVDEGISNNAKKVEAANNYNVFDIPLESPNHGSRTLVSSPFTRFVPSGTGPGITNGWHNDGTTDYTMTRGNNVYAKEDLANNNGTGTSPSSPILEFNHPYTFGINTATGNQNAAITNLFYWNNLIHDILWKYGFDEPSGNFQHNNQGRGGLGNDFVYADAQDGGGSNNANFSTPADGGNGRMQMYLWRDAGTPSYQPDGDFDNGIIAHEYGHGWSTRLTGGPANSSCLQNGEQGGEGWSDYAALMFCTDWASLTPTTASANIPRGIGTYALGQPITGAGIRPYRYSYDKANINNGVTYAKVGDSNFSQPHGIGSIWATMLWDMTWEIIFQDNQIVSNIYTVPANALDMKGNIAALKLVNEGLRLQPCSPSFVDARDAILRADQMLFGGRYRCAISKAFSRRGLGLNASTGASADDRIVTEDFTPLPGNALSSPTNLTICSGKAFNYSATSLTSGTTYTWNRPAVAGITNVAATGNAAIVEETLVNTTNEPITVTYFFTLTPELCGGVPTPQSLKVIVNPTVIPTVANYSVCQNGTVPTGQGLKVPQLISNTANGNLTASSPTFMRPNTAVLTYYKAYNFISPSTGVANFEVINAALTDGADTYIYLYQNSFNPLNPGTNLIAADDDSGINLLSLISKSITQGTTYILVITTYDSGSTGTFSLQSNLSIFSSVNSWFKDAVGGVALLTGTVFNPVGLAGSGLANTATVGTSTFYVENDKSANCRTPVTFNIIAPTPTGTANANICYNTIATLSGSCTDGIIKWYDNNGTTLKGSGSPFITDSLIVNTTFKVRCETASCIGNFMPVSVVVNPMIPAPNVQADTTIFLGENVLLTAAGCSGAETSLNWYKTSNNFLVTMPVLPNVTTNYYAKCNQISGLSCVSSKSNQVSVSVITSVTSIKTGDWNSSSTWNIGRVPIAGFAVIIDSNHTVTINGEVNAKSVEYKGTGNVIFSSANSKLNIGI